MRTPHTRHFKLVILLVPHRLVYPAYHCVQSIDWVKEVLKEDPVQVNQFSAKEVQKQALASMTGTKEHQITSSFS